MSLATHAAAAPEEGLGAPRIELVRQVAIRVGPRGDLEEVAFAGARLLAGPEQSAACDAARCLLERAGAVEAELSGLELPPGTEVDYVLEAGDDVQLLGDLLARALPELEGAGWDVWVDPDFPCRLASQARWCAEISSDEDGDWFELHLGVEIDGTYVDLLPAMVDLVSGRGLKLPRGRKNVVLPVGDGRYVTAPRARLERLMEIVRELYEVDGRGPRGGVQIPACLTELVGEVSACVQGVTGHAARPAGLHLVEPDPGRGHGDDPLAPPPTELPGLRATLRPYQAEGVAWLGRLAARGVGGVLADDMGLGKTLQTIAHLHARHDDQAVPAPALVIAPTSLVGNWRKELARFAPHLRTLVLHGPTRARRFADIAGADVVITTYPLLVRDLAEHAGRRYSTVVLDEAQTVKNARSQAHTAVRALEADQVLCLSGTPVENNLEELRAILELCVPGLLGDRESFRAKFRDPIERARDEERLAILRRRITPFVLRRLKRDVVRELPPKTEVVRPVELGSAQRDLYESIRIAAHGEVRRAIQKKGVAAAGIDILSALTKLRQVCCDPRLVALDAARAVDESAKLQALLDMLGELTAAGRRVLVFSQFTSMLALISQALTRQGTHHLVLTGASKGRQELVDRFEGGEADVFLISLKAGGTGLNLVSADTVIHYDPWWNPAAQRQATDRAYRIGQRRPVHVYQLIVAGSVEARMVALQRRKQALAEGLFAGEAAGLSERDVEDLFAPLQSDS